MSMQLAYKSSGTKNYNSKLILLFVNAQFLIKFVNLEFLTLNLFFFIISDIDECSKGNDTCHTEATCNNTLGSYTCTCRGGYEGDGKNCQKIGKVIIESIISVKNISNQRMFGISTRESVLNENYMRCNSKLSYKI